MHAHVATPAEKSALSQNHLFGLPLRGFLGAALIKKSSSHSNTLKVFGHKVSDAKVLKELSGLVSAWQVERWLKSNRNCEKFFTESGELIAVRANVSKNKDHGGLLTFSEYAVYQSSCGGALALFDKNVTHLSVEFISCSEQEKMGTISGLEISSYRYKNVIKNSSAPVGKLEFIGIDKKSFEAGLFHGISTNVARHLVNLPPADLNPKSYANAMKAIFKGSKSITVDVWNDARLKKENMGLILAVGQAAPVAPCMVHIKYRPPGSSSKKPIAIVGKGVTFDTGGLDLKPAQYMRLMKKDMGGSASCAGIAYWLHLSGVKQPVDIYLGLAENACDGNAFHPSDVLTSRNGMSVEIDNTDAEGRLVMADVLDVAVTKKGRDAPRYVIDVATLTGAARVALGLEVGGLFSDNDELSKNLLKSAKAKGDLCWRMPLFAGYESQLNSQFADTNHCSTVPQGGAISAALFLKKFTRNVPWAHFDVMAWSTKPKGAIRESGGNGQVVQLMSDFIKNLN